MCINVILVHILKFFYSLSASKSSLKQQHADNCTQEIKACISCEKNSFLNPIRCYCRNDLKPSIGILIFLCSTKIFRGRYRCTLCVRPSFRPSTRHFIIIRSGLDGKIAKLHGSNVCLNKKVFGDHTQSK